MKYQLTKLLCLALLAGLWVSTPAFAAPPDGGKGGSAGDIEELQARVSELEMENGLQGADIDNLQSASAGQELQIGALDARLGNAENGLANLATSLDSNQIAIDDLLVNVGLVQNDLAAQQETIARQQNIIVSLRNVMRANRKLVKAQTARSRFGRSAEAMLDLNNRVEREEDASGVPVEMTYLTYRQWVNQARDIGETTRCLVQGMTPHEEDDCVMTDGAEIPPEDQGSVILSGEDYAHAEQVNIVTQELVIEPFISELELRVDALGNRPSPCMVWKNTRGILAEYACIYFLDKVEARAAVQAQLDMMLVVEASSESMANGDTEFIQTELDCELNAVNLAPGEQPLTCENESANELVEAWDTINIKGEKKIRKNTGCALYDFLFAGCDLWPTG